MALTYVLNMCLEIRLGRAHLFSIALEKKEF